MILVASHHSVPETKLPAEAFPLPSPLFTGRDDILERMDRCFSDEPSSVVMDVQRIFVLFGLGGAGKTQIAWRFVQKYRNRYVYPQIYV